MSMREEIETIIKDVGDVAITATMIVDRARDGETFPALNKHLWQAPEHQLAQEARIHRAHRLLITMQVTVAETGDTTRMLLHTRGTPGYQSLDSVIKTPDLAAAKIKQLMEDISRARGRLRAFKAALPVDVATGIDDALEAAENRARDAIAEPSTVAA